MVERPGWAKSDGATETTSDTIQSVARRADAPDWVTKAQPDPDPIDYGTGAPFWVRRQLSRASNKEEAEKVLSDIYGKGNFGTDHGGKWWVRENVSAQPSEVQDVPGVGTVNVPKGEKRSDKRRVEVFGRGMGNFLETTGAQVSAAGWPTAGAFTGGAALSEFGPLGTMAGAGVGGAVGKLIDEGIKQWEGFYKKKPTEAVGAAVTDGALYAAFEGAGPVAKKVIVDPAKRALRAWGGVTPETQAMGRKMVTEGAKPQLAVVAPKMKALQYDQMVRNLLSGDPKEPHNVAYLGSRMFRLLKDQGLNEKQIMATLKEVNDKSAALSSRTADEAVSGAVQRRIGSLRASADSNMSFARKQLSEMEGALRRWADAPPGELPNDVAEQLQFQRREFGRQMSDAYDDVHAMTGEQPVVPWAQMRKTAADYKTELETSAMPVPPMVERLANDKRPMLTIKEAHNLRTELRARAEDMFSANPLAPGPGWKRVNDLARSVDEAFDGLADSGELGDAASKALRDTDRAYGEGMKKFNDANVQKLVTMVRRGLAPDAEMLTREIFQAGYTKQAQEVWGMMTPEIQGRIQTTLMRDIINSSSERTGQGMMLDPARLRAKLRDPLYRRSIEVAIPREALNQVDGLAQGLSALGGKVDVADLAPGRIKDALEQAIVSHREIDEFAKAHPLRALTSGNPYARDRAADAVLKMGDEAAEDMQRFFSPEEMESVRSYALKQVLSEAMTVQATRAGAVLGSEIEKAMAKYTRRQQEIWFPGGLGEDLRELARDSRFLFPFEFGEGGKDFGGSLAAAHIKGAMPSPTVWIPYIWKHLVGHVADSPGLMRVLVDIKRADPTYGRVLTKQVLRYMAISKMTEQEPRGNRANEQDSP